MSTVYSPVNDFTFEVAQVTDAKADGSIRFAAVLFIPAFINEFMKKAQDNSSVTEFSQFVSDWVDAYVPNKTRYRRIATENGDVLRMEEISIYDEIKFKTLSRWLRDGTDTDNVPFEVWLKYAIFEGALRHSHTAISGCSDQFAALFTESQFFTDKITLEMYANVALFVNKIVTAYMK